MHKIQYANLAVGAYLRITTGNTVAHYIGGYRKHISIATLDKVNQFSVEYSLLPQNYVEPKRLDELAYLLLCPTGEVRKFNSKGKILPIVISEKIKHLFTTANIDKVNVYFWLDHLASVFNFKGYSVECDPKNIPVSDRMVVVQDGLIAMDSTVSKNSDVITASSYGEVTTMDLNTRAIASSGKPPLRLPVDNPVGGIPWMVMYTITSGYVPSDISLYMTRCREYVIALDPHTKETLKTFLGMFHQVMLPLAKLFREE